MLYLSWEITVGGIRSAGRATGQSGAHTCFRNMKRHGILAPTRLLMPEMIWNRPRTALVTESVAHTAHVAAHSCLPGYVQHYFVL